MDAKKQAGVIERRAREGSSRAQYLLAAGHAGKLTNLHLEEIETLLQQEIGDGVAQVACRRRSGTVSPRSHADGRT